MTRCMQEENGLEAVTFELPFGVMFSCLFNQLDQQAVRVCDQTAVSISDVASFGPKHSSAFAR